MTEFHATSRLLKRAQYRNHRATARALAEVGTTLAQWDGLRAIAEAPDSSAHDLAVATFQSDQAFGTLANRLEAHGLIQRTAGKGRRVEHRLTAAGKNTLVGGGRRPPPASPCGRSRSCRMRRSPCCTTCCSASVSRWSERIVRADREPWKSAGARPMMRTRGKDGSNPGVHCATHELPE